MNRHSLKLFETSQYCITFQSFPPDDSYIELNQTHSSHICELNNIGKEFSGEDGIIFSFPPPSSVVIKTADCFPICFIGVEKVALIHAGWRGVKLKIQLDQLIKELAPHTIITGPSICDQCFEVTDEFHHQFPGKDEYFQQSGDQLFFHLKTLLKNQLSEHYPDAKVIISQQCTRCDERWHSHRRNKTKNRNFTVFQKR